jgi:SAM-dependent methyltransferase
MTLGAEYFSELYGRRDDPWRLAERWYEKRKRALTVAILGRQRYGSVLEVGCSIGELSAELAPRCDRLLAIDIAAEAVATARDRLVAFENVEFAVMDASRRWPEGSYDLVVISEVGYYLDEGDLRGMMDPAVTSLTETGTIVLCHWRHLVTDYPLHGDQVHEIVRSTPRLKVLAAYSDDDFRLELLARDSETSVASKEGLV